MVELEVLVNPNIHEAIAASQAIRMDNAAGGNLAPNTALQRGFGCISDDLGVDAVTPLEQTKDDSFDAGSKSTLAMNAFGTQADSSASS